VPRNPSLADVVEALDGLYPPAAAAEWDAVGPVCGEPTAEIRTVLFAIDPVDVVVDEALAMGADLLVTHHPLYLRGTSSVYAGSPKGRIVHRLITGGCGLVVAHTNADVAADGVSEALARAIGIRESVPLIPDADGKTGTGRIGVLRRIATLGEFAHHVGTALPPTSAGLRVAGDLNRPVRKVAVCGGAGDAYLGDAHRAEADVYVTADLRHHYVSEHLSAGGPALVDPGHWASEWPWLPVAARLLAGAFGDGSTVSTHVSTTVTDPWSTVVRTLEREPN
jgi:dinuclear metal center YbgI/SA1388 family protein